MATPDIDSLNGKDLSSLYGKADTDVDFHSVTIQEGEIHNLYAPTVPVPNIGTGFLFMVLFLPRLTLLYCYMASCMPVNPTDFYTDVAGFLFLPRCLVAYWLYMEGGSPFWCFLLVFVDIATAFKVSVRQTKSED